MTPIEEEQRRIKQGCHLRESIGSPICQEGALCNDCENELKGFEKGVEMHKKWVKEQIDILRERNSLFLYEKGLIDLLKILEAKA